MRKYKTTSIREILSELKKEEFLALPKNVKIYNFDKTKKDSENIIEKEIEKIFEEIKIKSPENLCNTIFYLLGELADNIDQHSHFSHASIIANYDKNKKEIYICVFDNGLTIPGSFEARSVSFKDDSDAVKQALEGKSTKKEGGRGTGLRSSKNLVENGLNGDFFIISRKGFIHKNIAKIRDLKLNGTFIYIKFKDPGKSLNIYKYIE